MSSQIPNPSKNQIKELCIAEYGFTGELTISRLPGENTSYQITTHNNQIYILKLANNALTSDRIEVEHQVVEHLISHGIDINLPRTIPTNKGRIETATSKEDNSLLRGRLLNYVPGTPWCETDDLSNRLLSDLGRLLGRLDYLLEEFNHPAAYTTHQWDLTKVSQHRQKINLISNPSKRKILEWFFHYFAASTEPYLESLPHSIIHGDVNDENILVTNGKISGLLDFGDCLYNPTICELAIATAYAMLDQTDPLEAGKQIVQGYHSIHPLQNDEFAVLFPLICARLITTITIAAERRQIAPDHPNWFVTEERAWLLAEKLYQLTPEDVSATLAQGTELQISKDTGASTKELLRKRNRTIGPSLSLSYNQPLKIIRGRGQYLFDDHGRPYLDLVNNVCHVGHCHPRVVEAGQRQMALLNTNTRYLNDNLTEYAERLCATLPKPLDTCYFVNSGSEANELALRLAMTHTGRRDFIVLEGAYHGHTSNLINISPYKFMGKGGSGQPPSWVHVVPMPDGYRGIFKGDNLSTGIAYGNEVANVISEMCSPLAGMITESLMGCGGQIIPPPGYFETAFHHVRAAGGLCIIDEVQVGFGRVGTHFWAFERQNVVPDIVVMGKPIGNGHPMAAVVTTREIADSFNNGMEFFSTFGGNPVSCAIGLAVLDVIHEERLQEHALDLGLYFMNGISKLKDKHAVIGDVRGAGLFIGVEFVEDRDSLKPASNTANKLIQIMKVRGVLLSTDGPLHNVIKIKPPMVINSEDVDMVLRSFDDALSMLQ
jgi:4-aminobutyrate aminotransferase-like enzyme/Ser/Thr protein kinase RdoA (MazF antagonist)